MMRFTDMDYLCWPFAPSLAPHPLNALPLQQPPSALTSHTSMVPDGLPQYLFALPFLVSKSKPMLMSTCP